MTTDPRVEVLEKMLYDRGWKLPGEPPGAKVMAILKAIDAVDPLRQVDRPKIEYAVIQDHRTGAVNGYIPHSALASLGTDLNDGTTFFSVEQSAAIREHPEYVTPEQWERAERGR